MIETNKQFIKTLTQNLTEIPVIASPILLVITEDYNETLQTTSTIFEDIQIKSKLTNDYFSNISNGTISNQTFMILMAIIALLSIVIIVLFFSNRKRLLKRDPLSILKDQCRMDPSYVINNQSIPIGYFTNPVLQQQGFKLNMLASNQPRTSNDSMAHLLNTTSRSSSYIDPSLFIPLKTGEYYEDISLRNYNESRQILNVLNQQGLSKKEGNYSENEYAECPTSTSELLKSSVSKLNDYCYIPTSLLQDYPNLLNNPQVIADSFPLNYETNEYKFTSTPSVPKTLPPTNNDGSVSIALDMTDGSKSETLIENITKDLNAKENVSNAEIDEYQTPSNLPTFNDE